MNSNLDNIKNFEKFYKNPKLMEDYFLYRMYFLGYIYTVFSQDSTEYEGVKEFNFGDDSASVCFFTNSHI